MTTMRRGAVVAEPSGAHPPAHSRTEALMFVVAGVTGHVGSVVAEQLLAKGQKVKVLVRDAAKGAAWSKKGAEVAQGSLEDQAFLTNALRGATGFFTLLPPNLAVPDIYAYQR